MTTVTTHAYVERASGSLLLDVHRPDRPSAGVVVYLHGGGFAAGDRAMDRPRVEAMVRHGLTVVVPDYRLAPAAFPDPVDDVLEALAWIGDHPDEVGSTRIGLWGASAGAVLAGLAGLRGTVDAVVSWFGFGDITTVAARSPLEEALLPPGPENALLGVDDVRAHPDLMRAASPVHQVRADAPPFLIAHGDRDRMVDEREGRRLHDALTAVGARSTFVVLGGAGHEDPAFDEPTSIAMTAAFFTTHFIRQEETS
ncbi:hypothetical protein nbrc107696_45350 [Gordonia spumicola]|uniref:BD-FAE-like domain-containing protein n=1 Tax=Gordonia spumicola TaxID=589161 RepID=A0A7I9V6A4_9ACTN|nr:alpha/beta hydrolase [Gordonia spumicola]GEE00797.1 hypothetical protein nbrc107696_12430 [Gordonia spumicola]GEE04089.1 hypothetical protein nbrc107696_45350 [Gordonia spumicola]